MKTSLMNITKGILLFSLFTHALLSCKNPFVSGLGEKVDITPPKINDILPKSGEFIKGNQFPFSVTAEDDIGVTKVEFRFRRVNEEPWDARTMALNSEGIWIYSMDTKEPALINEKTIEDGEIEAMVIAFDGSGRSTLSSIISYTVKNSPPRISISNPMLDNDFWKTVKSEEGFYIWSNDSAGGGGG